MQPMVEELGVLGATMDRAEWQAAQVAEGEGGITLVAKAQRLAELQEELHQLERLTTAQAGALDAGGFLADVEMPATWHGRIIELECEIEQLREEMLAEEAEQESAVPSESEDAVPSILDPIESIGEERTEREMTYRY